jgi:anthranilate phosphoribosyltransferase
MIRESIGKLVERTDLEGKEAEEVMKEIMGGTATPAQIASFLTALRMKGETVEEISACARIMREFSIKIRPRVNGTITDIVGTGGDLKRTFNVSTTSMFVLAGAGIPVAKHGNRSASSSCGSADVLEELGLDLALNPQKVQECIEKLGVGFMFAQTFHPSMKNVGGPRKEMGIRTVFNILGPLTNPANAQAIVVGVFSPTLTEKMAGVLSNLGVKRAVVVCGLDGMDEISICGPTKVSSLEKGIVKTYEIKPEEFGIKRAGLEDVQCTGKEEHARYAVRILQGKERGPKRDIVLMNAGAGIFVGGHAVSLKEGVKKAIEAVDSGKALAKLEEFIKFAGNPAKLERYL